MSSGPSLGVCYYPEHWPEEDWTDDAARMHAAGIRYVRIGEFAWSRIEPRRGSFDWAWIDRAIESLAGQDGRALFGMVSCIGAHPPDIGRNPGVS